MIHELQTRGNGRDGRDRSATALTDPETCLMWSDCTCSGTLDWFEALSWVEMQNSIRFLGYSDWRLPNIRELERLKAARAAFAPVACAEILWIMPDAVRLYVNVPLVRDVTALTPETRRTVQADPIQPPTPPHHPRLNHFDLDQPEQENPTMRSTFFPNCSPKARHIFALAGFVAAFLVASSASDAQQQGQGGPRGSAPPEALEACQGLNAGDACSMTTPRQGETVEGICIDTPDQQVACLPDGAERPPKR